MGHSEKYPIGSADGRWYNSSFLGLWPNELPNETLQMDARNRFENQVNFWLLLTVCDGS